MARRYHDRLVPLARLKRQQLGQLEMAVQQQMQVVTHWRQSVARLEFELLQASDVIDSLTRSDDATSLWMLLRGATCVTEQLGRATEQLRRATDEWDRRRAEYRQMSSDLEALQTLRAERREAYRDQLAQLRQHEIDQLAMGKWNLKQSTTVANRVN